MKDTKDKIIKQSIAYFSENDYERSSLNDIAKALNITKGGIYHYFRSKDDLFLQSIMHILTTMEQILMPESMENMSFQEILDMLFQMTSLSDFLYEVTGIPALTKHENLIYLMFAGIKKFPEVREKMDALYTAFGGQVTQVVVRGQQEGAIRADLDAEALAFQMSAFFEGAFLLDSVESSLNLSKMAPRVLENLKKSIKP